ncbi:gamma-glutamyl-gamma-aminobutyrate hydrolase family protein [Luteimonas sp. BDR2-5]|uniref:type 1 glutamine amidotransferase n=1 Tax=Proluteimonas luteida TaxID=2878685 RepID=UPI001E462713|nr:gamma-glutamyl-gamma-aminobutyrate hydrolase family protein [Luteimonas sp. BDR2-5]MCD9028634.1 gamma-glutamyl-gamma-aminobutyrate hydrolase family protein [Luteimonas sp. BDR2-5]
MPRILVFQHVAAEPLGTLDPLIRQRGHRIRFVNFEREPDAQPNVDRYRGLIVLGGPMNVEEQHVRPHLRTELRAIERMLQQGKPVLGICLGAQLLAHVLGAPVRRIARPEIGWYPLRTTDAGRSDRILGPIGSDAAVFQWHGRHFQIPETATHLAWTEHCEQQAFRWGDNAYGFQFHLEMDEPLIERWLANPVYRAELLASGLPHDADAIRAHTRAHIATMQAQADQVFNNFLDLIGRPQRRIVLPSREFV